MIIAGEAYPEGCGNQWWKRGVVYNSISKWMVLLTRYVEIALQMIMKRGKGFVRFVLNGRNPVTFVSL